MHDRGMNNDWTNIKTWHAVQIFFITYTDGVDVGLVAGERLSAHALSNIPEFSGGITSTRDE